MNHEKAIQNIKETMDYLDKLDEVRDIIRAIQSLTTTKIDNGTIVAITDTLVYRMETLMYGSADKWLKLNSIRGELLNEMKMVVPPTEEETAHMREVVGDD